MLEDVLEKQERCRKDALEMLEDALKFCRLFGYPVESCGIWPDRGSSKKFDSSKFRMHTVDSVAEQTRVKFESHCLASICNLLGH